MLAANGSLPDDATMLRSMLCGERAARFGESRGPSGSVADREAHAHNQEAPAPSSSGGLRAGTGSFFRASLSVADRPSSHVDQRFHHAAGDVERRSLRLGTRGAKDFRRVGRVDRWHYPAPLAKTLQYQSNSIDGGGRSTSCGCPHAIQLAPIRFCCMRPQMTGQRAFGPKGLAKTCSARGMRLHCTPGQWHPSRGDIQLGTMKGQRGQGGQSDAVAKSAKLNLIDIKFTRPQDPGAQERCLRDEVQLVAARVIVFRSMKAMLGRSTKKSSSLASIWEHGRRP